jgi:hypothetical protein
VEAALVDPDLRGRILGRLGCQELEEVRTLFSTTEGVTQDGRESAASISRNSPSESRTLQDRRMVFRCSSERVLTYLIVTSHFSLT